MPVTLYEPTSLAEAVAFLEATARTAAQANDAVAFGVLTSAMGIIQPALRWTQEQQEAAAIQQTYQARVEEIRQAADELGLGLHCTCPNCEAARLGREDPECDCEDCQRMRGEIADDEVG